MMITAWVRIALVLAALVAPPAALGAGEASAPSALHVLNRLGYGPRPGDVERVNRIGIERYIEEQLHPETIPLPAELKDRVTSLPTRRMTTGELISKYRVVGAAGAQEEVRRERQVLRRQVVTDNHVARLVRAIESPRQLEEVMVEFWFNHFNVFAGKGLDVVFVGDYEERAIRPYVLGRFRDLLGATAHHPAMLFYLDNWLSVAPGTAPEGVARPRRNGINENYARELMELHTLGVDGGYTQRDVTELARMLTGWTFQPAVLTGANAAFVFDARRHDNGDKTWLGKHVGSRGQEEGEWALDVLAAHPATARHIGAKLAQYFVSDTPTRELVDALSRRFLDTQGDIRAVLKTLFASREFREAAAAGSKFKTPYQYVVSAARAADLKVTNVAPLQGALYQLGMPLYGCQTPDGYKNTESAWLNGEAMTRRLNFATALATGQLPLASALDANAVQATLGNQLAPKTLQAVASAEPPLRAALLLGSPDFMRR